MDSPSATPSSFEPAHASTPPYVSCPFDAPAAGALIDRLPSACRIRSQALSASQRFTPPRGLAALSHAAYAHGIAPVSRDVSPPDARHLSATLLVRSLTTPDNDSTPKSSVTTDQSSRSALRLADQLNRSPRRLVRLVAHRPEGRTLRSASRLDEPLEISSPPTAALLPRSDCSSHAIGASSARDSKSRLKARHPPAKANEPCPHQPSHPL